MNNTLQTSGGLLGLHVLTSMHPGSGAALGTVDLPVQRERHTRWPNIAGSALKGVMRDACRERLIQRKGLQDEPPNAARPDEPPGKRKTKRDLANEEHELVNIFGPPSGVENTARAGAVSVTDARLALFPVRSLHGVFALVTCPAVLERLERDATLANLPFPAWSVPEPPAGGAAVCEGCACLVAGTQGDPKQKSELVLEEFQFHQAAGDASPIAQWIAEHLTPTGEAFDAARRRLASRLVVLHDDDFTHFVEHATEVVARIGLDYETKTVKDGALFYQEFLPPESLFYSVLLANPVRDRFAGNGASANDVLAAVNGYLEETPTLQIGGDETTGKGYCATRLFHTASQ